MIEQLIEVQLSTRDDFLKIAETLTRIGVKSAPNKLTQTAHILHKRGKYYICHYLEMFMLDGYDRSLTADDIERRNAVVKLLEQWKLCTIVDPSKIVPSNVKKLHIVQYNDKSNWILRANYTIGKKKACTTNSTLT